jgi:hypothetical protein
MAMRQYQLRPRKLALAHDHYVDGDDGDDDEVLDNNGEPSLRVVTPTKNKRQSVAATSPKRSATSILVLTPAKKSSTAPIATGGPNIHDMNIVQINDYFKAVLKGQDETMDRLSDILYRFNNNNNNNNNGGKKILTLLLSGMSGVGKTETAHLLKKLYCVDDKQYIKRDLTGITNAMQLDQILGAAPGLSGCTSRSTLPMELLRAVGRVPHGRLGTDQCEYNYQEQQRYIQGLPPSSGGGDGGGGGGEQLPATILLHLDEVDKADSQFLSLLLNFMENGELTASNSDVKFVLPGQTRLIIVLTANYALDAIARMDPLTEYDEARRLISKEMEEKGVSRAVLGRLYHNILPYFELDPEIVRTLSEKMIAATLEDCNHPYRSQFTRIDIGHGTEAGEIIGAIRSRYMGRENTDLGMRALVSGLETFKTSFYYGIANSLLRHGGDSDSLTAPVLLNMVYNRYECGSQVLDNLMNVVAPQAFARNARAIIAAGGSAAKVGLLMVYMNNPPSLVFCMVLDGPDKRRILTAPRTSLKQQPGGSPCSFERGDSADESADMDVFSFTPKRHLV